MFGKNKPKKEKVLTPGEDDIGPYPAKVDDNPTEVKVLDRAIRMLTIGFIVSAAVNAGLLMLLMSVFPLKEVYPYLVTFQDKSEQVIAIEPLSTSSPGIAYATESNIREYVNQRHSFYPVPSRMDAQWGPASKLAAMSSDKEYGEFQKASEAEKSLLSARNLTREIQIESVTMLRPDTWQVAFKTNDSVGADGGTLTRPNVETGRRTNDVITADLAPQINTKSWIATLEINYEPQSVSYDNRLLNPLGFTVTDYSVTSRN